MMTSAFPSRKAFGIEGPLAQLAELRTFNP
jgi:hypothetical protein